MRILRSPENRRCDDEWPGKGPPSSFLPNFPIPGVSSPFSDYGLRHVRPQGALFPLKNCKCMN